MNIDNIKTDKVPILDELVYNLKKLVYSSTIKREDIAQKYETVESERQGNIYISSILNRCTINSFIIEYRDLYTVGYPEHLIKEALEDKSTILYDFRQAIVDYKEKQFIDNYNELNNYYRSLNGLPDLGDPGIKIDSTYLPDRLKGTIDFNLYLHEMDVNTLDVLYAFEVIDRVKLENPTKKYLDHMGSRRISIYDARTANNFDLLYTTNDCPSLVTSKFREKYELSKEYVKKVNYKEAYKIESDYYDSFIATQIIIQTIKDTILEIPNFIIRRDFFDIRTIQLMFESNGIDFFEEIPMRYQLAMVKNLNRLIKFKSTTTNIIDICSLFGFDNIEVFKYYLLRIRKKDITGRYQIYYKKDDKGNDVLDYEANYDLKFLKVPIKEEADNYIRDENSIYDYDEIVEEDKYWNGNLSHDYVKRKILEKEFNYVQSKYISIDTVYSLTELTFQMCYFYNILFDKYKFEEMLQIRVPTIDGYAKFNFTNLICYLYALMYEYNGIVDDIMQMPEQVLSIRGFNFKADMAELSSYVKEKGFTLEELGVSDFQILSSGILSYNQLMEVYLKNKKIHDHLVDQMTHADNHKIYSIYKHIYDALMIIEFNQDFFKDKDGNIATTYTDFLKDKDLILYYSIITVRNIDNHKVKQSKITELIDASIYAIEEYINGDEFKFIFSNMPTASSEAVKKYIYKVVNFFKSYKITIYGINTIYIMDDKLENRIKMIDDVLITRVLNKSTVIETISKLKKFDSILTKKEKIELQEQLNMEITYWINRLFQDNFDDLLEEKNIIKSNLTKKDIISIKDRLTVTRVDLDNI